MSILNCTSHLNPGFPRTIERNISLIGHDERERATPINTSQTDFHACMIEWERAREKGQHPSPRHKLISMHAWLNQTLNKNQLQNPPIIPMIVRAKSFEAMLLLASYPSKEEEERRSKKRNGIAFKKRKKELSLYKERVIRIISLVSLSLWVIFLYT